MSGIQYRCTTAATAKTDGPLTLPSQLGNPPLITAETAALEFRTLAHRDTLLLHRELYRY
jgi:hypothetical protein